MTNRIFTLPSGATVVLKAPSLDALTELHGLKVFFKDRVAKDVEAARLNLEKHRRDPTLYGIDQLQTSTPQMRDFINDSVEHRKRVRLDILDKLLDPATKVIGTPIPATINVPRLLALLPGKLSPDLERRQAEHLEKLMATGTVSLKVEEVLLPEVLEAVQLVFSAVLFEEEGAQHPRDTFAKSLGSFNRKAKKLTIEQNPILRLTPLKLPKEGRDFVNRRVFTCGDLRDALVQLSSEHEYRHSNLADLQPLTKHYML